MPRTQHLVFPAHPGAEKRNPSSVRRPHRVRVIPVRIGQFAQSRTVQPNGIDLEISGLKAGERDTVSSR